MQNGLRVVGRTKAELREKSKRVGGLLHSYAGIYTITTRFGSCSYGVWNVKGSGVMDGGDCAVSMGPTSKLA